MSYVNHYYHYNENSFLYEVSLHIEGFFGNGKKGNSVLYHTILPFIFITIINRHLLRQSFAYDQDRLRILITESLSVQKHDLNSAVHFLVIHQSLLHL